MGDWNSEANQVFLNALECDTSEARQRYIDSACGNNADLRRAVQELLIAHEKSAGFLETQPSDWPSGLVQVSYLPITEVPGAWVGRYKLAEKIAEGGMGAVYVAEQEKPVRRRVALKIIKPGLDTQEVIDRFEAERQALALMDHPNIAKVLDAGTTDSCRPFFVMELVHGVPITEFCDLHRLTLEERLVLFVQVCQAVQHAHHKGIIHRDIKPSNVLVTRHDGTAVPKVIDFGVAKAINQRLTERSVCTRYAQMIGTPLYMSPEQAEMTGIDVDTRTDVYSLGVLLYELIAGSTPFDKERLSQVSFDEMRRILREEDSLRPSQRLAASQDLSSIAASRGAEPGKLLRRVRGELDWIVMRAMEKDRERRYETANALAEDVQHYLSDEPVHACPPSMRYRLHKSARRHRTALTTAGLVATALLVGTVVSAWQAVRATQAMDAEAEARRESDRHADQLRQSIEDDRKAHLLLDRGQVYAWWRRWDDAEVAYAKAIELRPNLADSWHARGQLYVHLGLWELAGPDLAQAYARQESPTTGHYYFHALLQCYLGDTMAYREVYRQMRRRFARTTNPAFAIDVVRTGVILPDAEEDVVFLARSARSVVESQYAADWHSYVASLAYFRAGQYEQSLRAAHEIQERNPGWGAVCHPVVAMACFRAGRIEEARGALREAGAAIDRWSERMYRAEGDGRWPLHQNAELALPIAAWDWLEMLWYYREAHLLIEQTLPADDPRWLVLRARSLAGLQRRAAADAVYREAQRLRPDDSQIKIESCRNRGYLLACEQRWPEAAAEFSSACRLHPEDPHLWEFVAVCELAADDLARYRSTCEAMFARFEKTTDPSAAYDTVFACMLRPDALSRYDKLLPLAQKAATWGYGNGRVLGAALYRAGLYEEALQCLQRSAELRCPEGWELCFQAMAHQRLGHAESARRCLEEARQWTDQADRGESENVAGTVPVWGGWVDRMRMPLLVRETESLLRTGAGASGSSDETLTQK